MSALDLDFSRCRLAPFQHQREDIAWLMARPYALIASEMRTGKSLIVVVAAQLLFEANVIDRVIVIAPAPVRDVWADRTLGEIAKHAFLDLPATVTEYHARTRTWLHGGQAARKLDWYVSNFEFLRSATRLDALLPLCGPKTLLVGDESSFLKNHAAQQTKAFLVLRKNCGRVVLLNGTPIFHSPLDLFSQGNILSPDIIGTKYVTHFKARYSVQVPVLGYGGKPLRDNWNKPILKIDGWVNLDDLERRFAPVTVRRLQKDCLDLPPKLDPVTLTATLSTSWPHYKHMRDDMVVWLGQDVATAATAATKVLRLSQITSGFLGGVEGANIEPVEDGLLESLDLPCSHGWHFGGTCNDQREAADTGCEGAPRTGALEDPNEPEREAGGLLEGDATNREGDDPARRLRSNAGVQAVGREKLDVLLWFIEQQLAADPNVKVVAWCHFRAELFRMLDAVAEKFPQVEVGSIQGGQKRADRLRALALLKPETAPAGPVFVGGVIGTGSFGLDMCAAHTCVTVSDTYSPGKSAQTLDRVYGPGQRFPIAYYQIIAVGPKGQRTVDHDILTARMAGENVATRTASAWVRALQEE